LAHCGKITKARLSLGLIGVLILVGVIIVVLSVRKKDSTLKIGFPYTWGNLTPPLQHTVYADTIIKNEFEPLVRFGLTGTLEPLAAKSWIISPDYRVFIFKIDNARKFSDGTVLTAAHFKNAWEHGLTVQPKSANSSLQDLLYKVEGYEDFERTKKFSGLIAKDDTTFEIHFRTPFRMALDHLSGARFGVFMIKDGKYFGTGSYAITSSTETTALLERNPFAIEKGGFERIEISVIDPSLAGSSLKSGRADIFAHAHLAAIEQCATGEDNIGCIFGDKAQHSVLFLNRLQGRFFSNSKHRQAFQALVLNAFPKNADSKDALKSGFSFDPQVFLPVQTGRITEGEVQSIIDRGKPFIPDFIKATREAPLFYAAKAERDPIFQLLTDQGVAFTSNSGARELKELVAMGYKTSEPDILVLRASVENGDPDGIYHFVGKNGAILFPMAYSDRVGELVEKGRSILERAQMNAYYQDVTRAILEEVPFVHLGFNQDILAFRKDRIQVQETVRSRRQFHFHVFEPL
jgi:ABC-type transport system substrate-binding protein